MLPLGPVIKRSQDKGLCQTVIRREANLKYEMQTNLYLLPFSHRILNIFSPQKNVKWSNLMRSWGGISLSCMWSTTQCAWYCTVLVWHFYLYCSASQSELLFMCCPKSITAFADVQHLKHCTHTHIKAMKLPNTGIGSEAWFWEPRHINGRMDERKAKECMRAGNKRGWRWSV